MREGLGEYRRRRDFGKTTEPRGETDAGTGRSGPGGSFVVHKHDARSLHYDFRLEVEGAVPLPWVAPRQASGGRRTGASRMSKGSGGR